MKNMDMFTYLWNGDYASTLQLLYLTDWKHCLITGIPATTIRWYHGSDGTALPESIPSSFNSIKGALKEAADNTIKITQGIGKAKLMILVNASFPILYTITDAELKLEKLVDEYLKLEQENMAKIIQQLR